LCSPRAGVAPTGRPSCSRAAKPALHGQSWPGPGRPQKPSELGRRLVSAQWPRDLNKSLLLFQICLNHIQTSEIHIYLNIAPKFLKLILLD
jgi:hypothetical protein